MNMPCPKYKNNLQPALFLCRNYLQQSIQIQQVPHRHSPHHPDRCLSGIQKQHKNRLVELQRAKAKTRLPIARNRQINDGGKIEGQMVEQLTSSWTLSLFVCGLTVPLTYPRNKQPQKSPHKAGFLLHGKNYSAFSSSGRATNRSATRP